MLLRQWQRRWGAGLAWAIAAPALVGFAPPAHAAHGVSSGISRPPQFVSSQVVLRHSSPSRYVLAYRAAVGYLLAHVGPLGQVQSGQGSLGSASTTAYVAAALAENGQITTADKVAQWLLQHQNAAGGWGHSLTAASVTSLSATARAVWALTEVADLVPASDRAALLPAIQKGANELLTLVSPTWGTFRSQPVQGAPKPQMSNAIAVVALEQATTLPWPASMQAPVAAWHRAAQRALRALQRESGGSLVSTNDFLALPRWNLAPNPVDAMRTVAAMPDLGFAYQGYGAKIGPGYFSMMDWTAGNSTFDDVIAAVHAGLSDQAMMQYNYGLTLQNPNGGFGSQAHPPVGPETGSFARGPNASSVSVTAHYLLATDALLRQGALGFGWHAATVQINQRTVTEVAPPAHLDPSVPMHRGLRVAVVISDPETVLASPAAATSSSNEADMELNAAYLLTQMGDQVYLFWYKPNHAENYYSIQDLWPNLSSFQAVVLSANALGDRNGYAADLSQHAQALQQWVRQGGRLLALGNDGSSAFLGALGALTQATASPINQVVVNGRQMVWNDAARAVYPHPVGYRVFAQGVDQGTPYAVAIGRDYGRGRVFWTTLDVASHAATHAGWVRRAWQWVTQGLPALPPRPSQMSYAARDQALYQAVQTVYRVPGTSLYRELSNPHARQRRYSYHWPFTQWFAGVNASHTVLGAGYAPLSADLLEGLQAYYDAQLNPPGYESYVAARGGGTTFFDDNGWTSLDLLRAYANTHNPQDLAAALKDISFLETGWDAQGTPPGGEFFNVNRIGRTQTATGSFLDALLRAYLVTHQQQYLTWAETVSRWDRQYMRGLNGIYWDNMNPQGMVGGTPFTYDTGVVLQADVLFWRATHNPKYLARAQQLAVAAVSAFVDPMSGVMVENAGSSNAPFNAILLRGLWMWYHTSHQAAFAAVLTRQADLATRYDRYADGIYGSNWTGINNPAKPVDLLTEGGTLRLLGMLAGH
jgi:hypothetical protein